MRRVPIVLLLAATLTLLSSPTQAVVFSCSSDCPGGSCSVSLSGTFPQCCCRGDGTPYCGRRVIGICDSSLASPSSRFSASYGAIFAPSPQTRSTDDATAD